MQVLSISTDRSMLTDGHTARDKAIWLATGFDHTHVVLFTTDRSLPSIIQLSERLTVYPTRSRHALLYMVDAWRIAKRVARQTGIDVVTTQDPFLTGLVGVWLQHKLGLPVQVQIHTDIATAAFRRHSWTNRVRIVISHYVLNHADRVRVVSQRVANYVRDRYEGIDVTVLPVWLNCPAINQVEPIDLHRQYDARTILLTASRLEPEKNIDHIITAFAQVDMDSAVLVIVGSGSLEARLKQQAAETAAAGRIQFVPWTSSLPGYLRGADIYVSASDYEGFGLSLAEAALAGCRIVSTSVGVVGHELRSDVYAAGSVDTLGAALQVAVGKTTSPHLQQEASKLCMDRAEYLAAYRQALVLQ